MVGDHIWPILFAVSLLVNVLLLARKPLLRLLRREDEVSEDEIMAMVEEGEESGAIERNEKELIENVFEFNDTVAEDVMVHRTDMVMVWAGDTDQEIVETIESTGLSRFPVYEEDADDIIGILSSRDYFLNSRKESPKPLRELLRPAYFVPESVPADVLFRDMQSRKTHMAIVVDEYGGTEGLCTLEDIVEELVGEIWDEHDEVIEEFKKQSDGSYLISCNANLTDLYDLFSIKGDCDASTVSGWVIDQLGRLPLVGDHFQAEGLDVTVTMVDHRRVLEVRVAVAAEAPETAEGAAQH